MIDYRELREKFIARFGAEPRIFRAPGRVNLIGEHTDYNGGFVLPMAIDREAAVAISTRGDRVVRAHTINFDETAEFDLEALFQGKKGFWLNYIEGVARILEQTGFPLQGVDMMIWSDVPGGAGLSSSAALEVATGIAMSSVAGHTVDGVTLAKTGQQTEHEYVGALVGIMDQFVSAHAVAGHALLLDCRSLEYENVPLDTSDVAVAICDTKVKHDLATSAYNTRREECEEAVRILKQNLPGITQLRDVSVEDFERFAETLPEPVRRRARHVVTEDARTLRAAEALKNNDLVEFGRLMWQSHASLRDDYEVSSRELDIMVDIASRIDGVLGARMTGGGFGGATVNLVKRAELEGFKSTITAEYQNATNVEPAIVISDPCAGASEVQMTEARHSGSQASNPAI
jgi:galactokinase